MDSQPRAGAGTWIAYSWLFEVLVYGLFTKLGLSSGVLMLTVVMTLLVAFALHYAVRRAGLPFLGEVILLAVVFASLKPILTPRPWLFPILFFAIELYILFQIRKTGRLAFAFVLPILFAQPARTIHLWFRDAHTFCLRRLGSETPTNSPTAALPAKAMSPIRVTANVLKT